MANKHKTYFSWSTGKDAALALYHLLQDPRFDIQQLLTTVNVYHDRVSMHGLRRSLLEQQVAEIGIPLYPLALPESPSMDIYNQLMHQTLTQFQAAGFTHSAYGDIFLEDLKAYRDQQMQPFGITGVYPIWQRDSRELIEEFIDLGFKAVVICANAQLLDESFVGREIDAQFLKDLPANVDPCGENGEFHTFCFEGPIFKHPITFEKGEKIYRSYPAPNETEAELGFWFIDLIPTASN